VRKIEICYKGLLLSALIDSIHVLGALPLHRYNNC